MKIGDVVLKVTMARFSRTLSTLVAAGVDIIKALEITGQTAGNWVVEEALADVRQKVHEGVPIAQPLIENDIFPPMVSQMVKIGEETGELEKMLGKIADFYEDEVDASIQSLTSIVEPLMMIGVGDHGRRHHHQHVPVTINGKIEVYNRCLGTGGTSNCVALVNFWRTLSNLTLNINSLNQDGCRASANFWAVSQAVSMRRSTSPAPTSR